MPDYSKEVQYLTELIRYYDRLSADDYVYPHTVYFGNDGYLTAIVETNEGALNAYFIDFKDLTLKAKLGMDPLSPKADAPGTTITSLNDGLIAFSKYHGQWTGNDLDTIYDAAGRTIHTSTLQAAGNVVYTLRADRMQAGIYTVTFRQGNQTISRRLVVR